MVEKATQIIRTWSQCTQRFKFGLRDPQASRSRDCHHMRSRTRRCCTFTIPKAFLLKPVKAIICLSFRTHSGIANCTLLLKHLYQGSLDLETACKQTLRGHCLQLHPSAAFTYCSENGEYAILTRTSPVNCASLFLKSSDSRTRVPKSMQVILKCFL